jgi:hypothetical protein
MRDERIVVAGTGIPGFRRYVGNAADELEGELLAVVRHKGDRLHGIATWTLDESSGTAAASSKSSQCKIGWASASDICTIRLCKVL